MRLPNGYIAALDKACEQVRLGVTDAKIYKAGHNVEIFIVRGEDGQVYVRVELLSQSAKVMIEPWTEACAGRAVDESIGVLSSPGGPCQLVFLPKP